MRYFRLRQCVWNSRMAIRQFSAAAFVAGLFLAAAGTSVAGPISVSYSAAGVQTPSTSAVCGATVGCTVGYETFSYAPTGSAGSYTSHFSSGTGTASAY